MAHRRAQRAGLLQREGSREAKGPPDPKCCAESVLPRKAGGSQLARGWPWHLGPVTSPPWASGSPDAKWGVITGLGCRLWQGTRLGAEGQKTVFFRMEPGLDLSPGLSPGCGLWTGDICANPTQPSILCPYTQAPLFLYATSPKPSPLP